MYDSAVNFKVLPWPTRLCPAAGPAPASNWTDAALLVLDPSVTSGCLALVRAAGSWPGLLAAIERGYPLPMSDLGAMGVS